jgi:hypothetical protein
MGAPGMLLRLAAMPSIQMQVLDARCASDDSRQCCLQVKLQECQFPFNNAAYLLHKPEPVPENPYNFFTDSPYPVSRSDGRVTISAKLETAPPGIIDIKDPALHALQHVRLCIGAVTLRLCCCVAKVCAVPLYAVPRGPLIAPTCFPCTSVGACKHCAPAATPALSLACS